MGNQNLLSQYAIEQRDKSLARNRRPFYEVKSLIKCTDIYYDVTSKDVKKLACDCESKNQISVARIKKRGLIGLERLSKGIKIFLQELQNLRV